MSETSTIIVTMKTILVNNASLSDYSEVIELLNEIFSEFPNNKKYSAKKAYERMKKANDSMVVKVFDNNRNIVAFSICYERYKNYYHIWQLGVKKEERNKGLATVMYEIIERYAKKNKYKGITLNTFYKFKTNIHLIENRGYKLYEKDDSGEYSESPKLMYRLDFR